MQPFLVRRSYIYVPDLYLAATTDHFPRGMVGRMSEMPYWKRELCSELNGNDEWRGTRKEDKGWIIRLKHAQINPRHRACLKVVPIYTDVKLMQLPIDNRWNHANELRHHFTKQKRTAFNLVIGSSLEPRAIWLFSVGRKWTQLGRFDSDR